MEATTLSENDELRLVSSFLEFAIGQTPETARWFLQARSWNLDEALFFFANQIQNPRNLQNDHSVRRTLRRATNSPHEHSSSTSGQNREGTSSVLGDRLPPLYGPPPLHLSFNGTFAEAKSAASRKEQWLLLNLQSRELSSYTLNRDTLSNDAVSRIIEANFVFLQIYDDTIEGQSVCTSYQLQTTPVVLVIDPTTGQQMHFWSGTIDPRTFLEDLTPFTDHSPRERSSSSLSRKRPRILLETREVTVSLKTMSLEAGSSEVNPIFPPLRQGSSNGDFQCRICVRLPDGRRLMRSFNKTDPIQLLWSFCYSQVEGSERGKPLKLTLAIPGSSNTLDHGSDLTFEQSGIENSLITVAWE